jgi:hypothetical protein
MAGTYSGKLNSGEYGQLTFSVSPGGSSVSTILVPNIGVACTPAGSFPGSVNLSILGGSAITPNASFTATGTQSGVFDNANAKFTYSLAGHFEGATPAGPVTVAGTLREDIVFAASGATETCSSDDLAWTATRS